MNYLAIKNGRRDLRIPAGWLDTPMQYLTRWRMQLATHLLERQGVGLAQVAAEIGYESEAAFNRAFKKCVGVPPGAWRRERQTSLRATAPQ